MYMPERRGRSSIRATPLFRRAWMLGCTQARAGSANILQKIVVVILAFFGTEISRGFMYIYIYINVSVHFFCILLDDASSQAFV